MTMTKAQLQDKISQLEKELAEANEEAYHYRRQWSKLGFENIKLRNHIADLKEKIRCNMKKNKEETV